MPTSQAPSLRIIDSIGSARGELRAIDTTDDTRLALTGTGTVGQTVQIHDGTTLLGTATVASNGHWLFHTGWLTDGQTYLFRASYEDGTDYSAQYQITIDAPWALAPQTPSFGPVKAVGGHQNVRAFAALKDDGSVVTWGSSQYGGDSSSVQAQLQNIIGMASPHQHIARSNDQTAPEAPSTPLIDPASDTGTPGDGITSNTTPTITGSAEAHSLVKLYGNDDTTLLGSARADDGGLWSITPSLPLAHGIHSLLATATDAAGNTSATSAARALTIDTTAPSVPTLTVAPASDSGTAGDGITSDTTPTITGTAEANSHITLYQSSHTLGTATADANGLWSITLATALAEGQHSLTATTTDAAGNTSAASAALALTIDTTAPGIPTLALATASDTGSNQGDSITSDATPTITGTAEANSHIALYQGSHVVGTTTADTDGLWSITLTTALAEGQHSLTATATDAAGNTSATSAALALTIDTTAPAVPTLTVALASDSSTAGDGITSDTTPTITGTAEAHSHVTLYQGSHTLGTATADANGLWSITLATALAEGQHSLTATTTDAAGNTSAASAALALTIDTTAPGIPTLALATASDTGSNQGDSITSDATPTITGTAEANSHIALYQGSHVVGTTTADTDGLWSITLATALAEGSHSLTATATDAAGNTSATSTALALTIDTTAPGIPTLALATASDTGSSQNDRITSDATPTITGTAEAHSHITLYQGSHVVGTTTADTDGLWSITLATALAEGSHSLTATATDAAGNTSAASTALALTIDTTAPAVPTLTVAPASDSSTAGDGITSDTTPTITGTAEAHSLVKLYSDDGNSLLGTGTTDANGLWSITLATALADGQHSLTATATDAAGNTSAASAALALTIDTTAPSVPIIGTPSRASNDTTPTITGTAEANSHVTLYQGSHTLGTATTDADGLWSITIGTALAKGQHILTATATDTAGNTSAASAALVLTIDTTVPFVPTLALATASDTGSHQGDRITSDTTPTITGVSEAHSHITLHKAGHTVGTATADENGSWSITLATALPDGQHSLTAIASDAAGNVSATSTALVLTIDTTAPSAAVLSSLETRTIAGPDTVVGRLSATDAGHSALSYTLSAGPGDADNVLFRIDAEAQLRLLDPAMAGAGVRSVRIAVSDAAGNVHEQAFAITVHANHAPVLTGVPADVQSVHVAATATLAGLGVADADGDALTVTLTPVNGSVEGLAQGSAQGGVVVGLEAAVWTLQGTAAGINALLANVGFSAVAVGTASLAIRVSDGHSVPASAVYAFRATDPASEADTDGDGIAAGIEAQVPGLHGGARGDGNGDGIADAQQAEVASLPWPGSGADGTLRYATLVQEAGQPLRSVVTATVPDGEGSLPAGLGLPLGSLGFAVETLPESGQGRFSLFIDGDVPVNGYFVQVAGQWVNLASGISTVGGKTRIDFEVADGSVFDRDGQTDGQLGVIGAPGWFAGNPDDLDGDQVPDRLEFGLGLKPGVKDNDVFGRDDLFVRQLYRDLLGREAEADGLAYWQEQLASNALTREQLYQSFWSSDEFQQGLSALVRLHLAETGSGPDALSLAQWRQADGDWLAQYLEDRFGGESDTAFVTQVYASLLGRPSDDGGFQYFMNRLGAGQHERDDVVLDVLHSDEFAQTHGSGVLLEILYSGMLGRASDAGGRAYWQAHLEPGQELLEGTAWFMASTEYYERFLEEVQAVMF